MLLSKWGILFVAWKGLSLSVKGVTLPYKAHNLLEECSEYMKLYDVGIEISLSKRSHFCNHHLIHSFNARFHM